LQALLDLENEFIANLAFEILEGIEMNEILKTHLWECPQDNFFRQELTVKAGKYNRKCSRKYSRKCSRKPNKKVIEFER